MREDQYEAEIHHLFQFFHIFSVKYVVVVLIHYFGTFLFCIQRKSFKNLKLKVIFCHTTTSFCGSCSDKIVHIKRKVHSKWTTLFIVGAYFQNFKEILLLGVTQIEFEFRKDGFYFCYRAIYEIT